MLAAPTIWHSVAAADSPEQVSAALRVTSMPSSACYAIKPVSTINRSFPRQSAPERPSWVAHGAHTPPSSCAAWSARIPGHGSRARLACWAGARGCRGAQAPRQFTKTVTLRSSDLNEVRKVKDALSHHLQERAGIDHSLPRGCELDSIDEGTVKLNLTARAGPGRAPAPAAAPCLCRAGARQGSARLRYQPQVHELRQSALRQSHSLQG